MHIKSMSPSWTVFQVFFYFPTMFLVSSGLMLSIRVAIPATVFIWGRELLCLIMRFEMEIDRVSYSLKFFWRKCNNLKVDVSFIDDSTLVEHSPKNTTIDDTSNIIVNSSSTDNDWHNEVFLPVSYLLLWIFSEGESCTIYWEFTFLSLKMILN